MKTDQHIAVLTYDVPHRKTYDTLCLLRTKGYSDVSVYAHSFTYKKKYHPLVEHRPETIAALPSSEEICRNLDYSYRLVDDYSEIKDDGIYLLCGAGVLNQTFVKQHRIINSHPGFIPYARGLDAYKWAIYENLPIGVTTHFLGDYVDAGEVIERRKIDVKKYDTFHSVAYRVYQNEIDMLVGAIDKANDLHTFYEPKEDFPVHKRMPHALETQLLNCFEKRQILETSGGNWGGGVYGVNRSAGFFATRPLFSLQEVA